MLSYTPAIFDFILQEITQPESTTSDVRWDHITSEINPSDSLWTYWGECVQTTFYTVSALSPASDLARWVMKCWSSVMRLFTGHACFTWIKPSVWLDKYQLGPARSPVKPSSLLRKWQPNSCGMNEEEISEWQPYHENALRAGEPWPFPWRGCRPGLTRWDWWNNNTHPECSFH